LSTIVSALHLDQEYIAKNLNIESQCLQ